MKRPDIAIQLRSKFRSKLWPVALLAGSVLASSVSAQQIIVGPPSLPLSCANGGSAVAEGAWNSYGSVTPVLTGGTGTSATAVAGEYLVACKKMFLHGQFQVTYTTAPTSATVGLPGGFTAVGALFQSVSATNVTAPASLPADVAGTTNINLLSLGLTASGQFITFSCVIEIQ